MRVKKEEKATFVAEHHKKGGTVMKKQQGFEHIGHTKRICKKKEVSHDEA